MSIHFPYWELLTLLATFSGSFFILKWERNDAPQRGEDREKPVTSLPTLQKTKAARIATVLVVDTY